MVVSCRGQLQVGIGHRTLKELDNFRKKVAFRVVGLFSNLSFLQVGVGFSLPHLPHQWLRCDSLAERLLSSPAGDAGMPSC